MSRVTRATVRDVRWIIEGNHYSKKLPSVSFAWKFIDGDSVVGCMTIGRPASPWLGRGICGGKYEQLVWELNRLVRFPNTVMPLSFYVGMCLRDIGSDMILVSYADSGWGHVGKIYQATNWLYTGLTKSRTDIDPGGGKHSRHYSKKDLGNRKFRSAKHRYVKFLGPNRKKIERFLKYPILDYPSGVSRRYDTDNPIPSDPRLLRGK